MEGLTAIDEELEALGEGRDDIEALIARAHAALPDRSEGLEAVDAMLENLGETVSLPRVVPVGIDIPRLELPPIEAAPDPAMAEVAEAAEPDGPDTAVRPSVPPAEPAVPSSAVALAHEADTGVDEIIAEGLASESGLDATDLFGDIDPTDDAIDLSEALAQVRAMTGSEAPPAQADSLTAEGPAAPEARARTEPPPPAETGARDSIEEIDLDELLIEEDDSFELMVEEDTFVGDADAVENAAESPAPPPPPAEGEGVGEGGEEDDPREQSFFKKLFG